MLTTLNPRCGTCAYDRHCLMQDAYLSVMTTGDRRQFGCVEHVPVTPLNPERLETVTRIEVIDEDGRAYARRDLAVEASMQDDGRTLKLFVSARSASSGVSPR